MVGVTTITRATVLQGRRMRKIPKTCYLALALPSGSHPQTTHPMHSNRQTQQGKGQRKKGHFLRVTLNVHKMKAPGKNKM